MAANTEFPVSAVLEKRLSVSPWADAYWKAVGILVGESSHPKMTLINSRDGVEQYHYSGLHVSLFVDECESYYHNMMSPQPGCYVVCNQETDQPPEPFLVSMSFDEAHAYQEGGREIYAVPIPGELYEWVERFVLDNYFPEKKRKRKLNDWKKAGGNVRA